MPDSIPKAWEPDPRQVGHHWRDMFAQPKPTGQPANQSAQNPARGETPREDPPDEDAPALDLSTYKPWIIQRVRSRPALMLELRRYEPRSGLWTCWAMSYPSLYAVETTGDRMLSLDFGTRNYILEGRGLDTLARLIQQGTVLAVVEHSTALWPGPLPAVVVTAVRRVEGSA